MDNAEGCTHTVLNTHAQSKRGSTSYCHRTHIRSAFASVSMCVSVCVSFSLLVSHKPGYRDALTKYTLKRLLQILLCLELCKQHRVLEQDPCLFLRVSSCVACLPVCRCVGLISGFCGRRQLTWLFSVCVRAVLRTVLISVCDLLPILVTR